MVIQSKELLKSIFVFHLHVVPVIIEILINSLLLGMATAAGQTDPTPGMLRDTSDGMRRTSSHHREGACVLLLVVLRRALHHHALRHRHLALDPHTPVHR